MALPSRDQIIKRLETTLVPMVAGNFGPVSDPAEEVKPHLDELLSKREYTVRDGILTLLAMEVEHDDVIDWRRQGLYNPARNASRYLGSKLYPRLHIAGSGEALQSGVKGVSRYIDRNNETWQAVLEWASKLVWTAPSEVLREAVAQHYSVAADALDGVSGAADSASRGASPEIQRARLVYGAGLDSLERGTWSEEQIQGHELFEQAGERYALEKVTEAFYYLAAGVAATARNLPAMPALDTPKLTFPAVFALLDEMLGQNSSGAHEQFIFAALLEAWRDQLGEPGVVETKNLNASDASAGTAADVQEKHRGQVTEAYEVTASDYATKIDQARNTLRRHDLRRVHIVARGGANATGDEIARAIPKDLDVTVLDVREEVRSMLARLGKPHRRQALECLYRLLVEKQANDQLVQNLVSALAARDLTETTT